VVTVLAAQSWTAASVGGSLLHNPLPTAIVHRMRPEEARVLSDLRGEAVPADALDLQPGGHRPWAGSACGGSWLPDATSVHTGVQVASGWRPHLIEGTAGTPDGREMDAEADAIADAMRQLGSVTAVIERRFGLTSKDGRPYREARKRVEAAIMRAAISFWTLPSGPGTEFADQRHTRPPRRRSGWACVTRSAAPPPAAPAAVATSTWSCPAACTR
jgi:hypothetical protein